MTAWTIIALYVLRIIGVTEARRLLTLRGDVPSSILSSRIPV